MRRIVLTLLSCFLTLASLTACAGAHEIDDWAYIFTIGVDKGVTDKFRFTFQMPTYKSGEGGGSKGTAGSQGADEYAIMSLDCPTFFAGINVLNTSLSRTLNFTHSKYLVISEDLAREGVGRLINGIVRSAQIRRNMNVIVVRGPASEFIKQFDPVIGTSLSKTQELLMQHQHETGFFDEAIYNQFAIGIRSTYTQPVAALAAVKDFSDFMAGGAPPENFKSTGDYYAGELPRSGGNKTEILGAAIFDGDKMVGELNGIETRAMLMAKGEFRSGYVVIPDPLNSELQITLNVHRQKKPHIKVTFRDGKPVIHIKVFLDGELHELQSGIEYENEKLKPVLENAVKTSIKNELDITIDKCKKLNCDVFNFGETAAMQFLTIQEWEDYNWLAHFKDAETTTEVEFLITRTGTLLKTSEIVTTEGKKK
jgi:spore germination protein KC